VLYRDFEPVAVLDWEMAGIGPRELDLGWLVFAHMVFEHIAGVMGLDGMPHFLRPDDVSATYESLTGYSPRDLDFYLVYAAIQWGIVFMRTGTRQVHFGEIEMPSDIHDLMHHRDLFRQLIES
jgi:aminoglycoside phosphotransferase (APT) family kinase protein